MIEDMIGIPASQQALSLEDPAAADMEELEDHKTLADYDMNSLSIVHLANIGLSVTVKTLTGKTMLFRMSPTASVDEIKDKISDIAGIPVYHQRLIWKGKELMSGRTMLDHYDIEGAVEINLVLA